MAELSRSAERPAGLLDAVASVLDRFHRGRNRQTKIRREPVGRALYGGNADAIQQIEHEVEIVLDDLAIRRGPAYDTRAARIEIEGTVRHQARQARDRVQPRAGIVATLLV